MEGEEEKESEKVQREEECVRGAQKIKIKGGKESEREKKWKGERVREQEREIERKWKRERESERGGVGDGDGEAEKIWEGEIREEEIIEIVVTHVIMIIMTSSFNALKFFIC